MCNFSRRIALDTTPIEKEWWFLSRRPHRWLFFRLMTATDWFRMGRSSSECLINHSLRSQDNHRKGIIARNAKLPVHVHTVMWRRLFKRLHYCRTTGIHKSGSLENSPKTDFPLNPDQKIKIFKNPFKSSLGSPMARLCATESFWESRSTNWQWCSGGVRYFSSPRYSPKNY